MRVTFYGTRGSVPVSESGYLEVGGNTACVLVTFDTGRILILDAGTGIRRLGNDLAETASGQDNICILLSHTHWDHIHGFPFFQPAYDPDQRLTICICGRGRNTVTLETIMGVQMESDFYPVPLDQLGAEISFWEPDITHYTAKSGVRIIASPHNHPGGAFSYRIEEKDKTLVYCTDAEHGERIDPRLVALSSRVDLLIHDAQFTPKELKQRKGWGHSSWEEAAKVAQQAQVKRLALFHHDPEHEDSLLHQIEREAQDRFAGAFLAKDGMEVRL